jgi:hypothetical protein
MLDLAGDELQVVLGPLPSHPDLYPLPVAIEVAGSAWADHDSWTSSSGVFPAGRARSSAPLEVRLAPRHWVPYSAKSPAGATTETIASFRLVRLACLPDR